MYSRPPIFDPVRQKIIQEELDHIALIQSYKQALVDFYQQNPNKLCIDPEGFASNLEFRLYTEWCTNTQEWMNDSVGSLVSTYWPQGKAVSGDEAARARFAHVHYEDKALIKWINQETHYDLERQGYKWEPCERKFITDDPDFSRIYDETRQKVLRAIVARGIEFFGKCEEFRWPRDYDKENLRCSLETYLTQ